jgi:uncharacterized protein (DUF433 family)
MNWSGCEDVDRQAGKVSGAPVVRGTRVPADGAIDNAEDGFTPEEIARDIFPGVPAERVRAVLRFARRREAHPA